MSLRVVFMGTPDFSVPILEAVMASGHQIAAVYSQPPRPSGRGMHATPSPVHQAAEQAGLEVRTPLNFKRAEDRTAFAALGADAAVVVAYGLILPGEILNAPRLGCFNVHASKLPRWRGAAPIQRAIMAGDRETAVMVMRMEEGLDTGPVCMSESVAITAETTAGDLHDELAQAGARIITPALSGIAAGTLQCQPQSSLGITYARKIDKQEARIDFDRPAADVVAHIHGLSPFPGAWFETGADGRMERIKVLKAVVASGQDAPGTVLDDLFCVACRSGAVRLIELQRAGKRPMSASEFARGFVIAPGTVIA